MGQVRRVETGELQSDQRLEEFEEEGVCARCKRTFDLDVLRPPARWLQITTIPLLAITSWVLVGNATAAYCPRCRRSINACLFFVFFMTVLIVGMMLHQKLFGPMG